MKGSHACRWWHLPDVGVWPQMGMLMCFQRLVELQESTRILMDLSATGQNPNHTYAELKVRSPRGCGSRRPSTLQTLTFRQTQLAASCRMSYYPAEGLPAADDQLWHSKGFKVALT